MLLRQKVFDRIPEALEANPQFVQRSLRARAHRAFMQIVSRRPFLQRQMLEDHAPRPHPRRPPRQRLRPLPPLLAVKLIQGFERLLLRRSFARVHMIQQLDRDRIAPRPQAFRSTLASPACRADRPGPETISFPLSSCPSTKNPDPWPSAHPPENGSAAAPPANHAPDRPRTPPPPDHTPPARAPSRHAARASAWFWQTLDSRASDLDSLPPWLPSLTEPLSPLCDNSSRAGRCEPFRQHLSVVSSPPSAIRILSMRHPEDVPSIVSSELAT